MTTAGLQEQIAAVQRRIAQACQRCGRDPAMVTLVAVTKGVSADTIQDAVTLGLTDLGENRVQEARSKQNVLGSGLGVLGKYPEPRTPNPEPIRWHLIGHLQRNKANDAVELFEVIHSIDSAILAEDVERAAAKRGRSMEVFVQVNVSGEATKFGCRPDDVPGLARSVGQLPHLRVQGFMTMAPFADDPETVRPVLRQLRALRDAVDPSLKLSMGMSQDFEVAIEEGADVIRVGTALFGT